MITSASRPSLPFDRAISRSICISGRRHKSFQATTGSNAVVVIVLNTYY